MHHVCIKVRQCLEGMPRMRRALFKWCSVEQCLHIDGQLESSVHLGDAQNFTPGQGWRGNRDAETWQSIPGVWYMQLRWVHTDAGLADGHRCAGRIEGFSACRAFGGRHMQGPMQHRSTLPAGQMRV